MRASSTPARSRRRLIVAALAVTVVAAAGNGVHATSTPADRSAPTAAAAPSTDTLRLGYFPNITHAPALVGIEQGIFAEHLGAVTLETQPFNAGPEAIQALLSGAVDATYVGPNPAINGFAQSDGEALRIVAGSTSGGAALVVREGIETPEDLRGTKLATPQLGNTQDVALRAWLAENGLEATAEGGGEVSILPQENGQTLEAFQAGAIDGAWLPEPWASRLVLEAGATVLVDERDLWPDGQWVTTHLVVRTEFLDEHPDVVKLLLDAQVASVEFVNANPAEAQQLANDGVEAVTEKRIGDAVIVAAWENLEFTNDPVASSLDVIAGNAIAVGLLEPIELDGIYDLTLLNEVLVEGGGQEVAAP